VHIVIRGEASGAIGSLIIPVEGIPSASKH
jgi:hypothetical protein